LGQRKRIHERQDGIIVLVVSFALDGRIEGRIEGKIDGRVFSYDMSFLYVEYGGTQANRITHEGEIDRCGSHWQAVE